MWEGVTHHSLAPRTNEDCPLGMMLKWTCAGTVRHVGLFFFHPFEASLNSLQVTLRCFGLG